MNETIWLSTEDGYIFPNEEEARKGYAQWCEDVGETFREEIFKEYYTEVTFDFYNRNYAGQRESAIFLNYV